MEGQDIGIYSSWTVLNHKLRDCKRASGNICYWTIRHLERKPFNFQGKRLYIAVSGYWQGYFTIVQKVGADLYFYSDSWVMLKGRHKRTQFRGFCYTVPHEENPVNAPACDLNGNCEKVESDEIGIRVGDVFYV